MPRLPPEPPHSLCRQGNTNTHSPSAIRYTSPPYSKHSNRGVKCLKTKKWGSSDQSHPSLYPHKELLETKPQFAL